MLLDKTITSATLPRQTNVLWIDTSGETKVSKAFIGGRWTPIGSTAQGTIDYNELENKPKINSTDLEGDIDNLVQEKLVSGETIKTVGGLSLLGSGNIPLPEGSVIVTQTTGDSTEAVMSQKAVTDEFKKLDETFAKKDGDYSEDGLVSAKAQNLVGEPIEITDAYTCKPTAYNQSGEPIEVADGRCEMKEIQGRGVAWNQLVPNPGFTEGGDTPTGWRGYTGCDNSNPDYVYLKTGSGNVNVAPSGANVSGHKYLIKFRWMPKVSGFVCLLNNMNGAKLLNHDPIDAWTTHKLIRISETSSMSPYGIIGFRCGEFLIDKKYGVNIIDLTLEAPHLASKANLTVAEVEAYLATLRTPQPYYAQNAGTLLGAKMLGWSMPKTPNLFNPTTGKATLVEYSYNEGTTDNSNKYEITGLSNLTDPVITFTPYTTGVALTVAASDGDITLTHDSTNGGDYFTIPSAGELTITGTGDKNYVCVKMVWDDSKAGEWFIYSLSDNEFDTAKIYHYNSSTEQYDQVFQDGILRATGDGSDAVRDRLFTWIDGEGNVKCGVSVNVGSRAYTSDDDSDSTVITDKTNTWYALVTPTNYTSDLYYKKSNNEYVPLEDMFPLQGLCCNWSYESLTQEALDNNGQPQSVTPQTVEEFESDEREKINTVIDTYISKAAVKGSFENLATAISSLGALTVGDFNSDGELTFSFTPAS